MATADDLERYQATIDGLSTVAFSQVKELLLTIDTTNPIEFRDVLLRTYPDLVTPFMSAASEVGAEWYLNLREAAGITTAYGPKLAQPVPDAQIDAGVRYSLSPLFRPAEFIGSDVLNLLAGVSQQLIANKGRQSITDSAYGDRVQVGVARIPKAGCCAFCGLLASRGPVYKDEASAGVVVGRGLDESTNFDASGNRKRGGQAKGVKIRGSQGIGNRFHKHCRCVPTPVFAGGDNTLVHDTQAKFTDLYQQSIGEKVSDYSKRHPDQAAFGATDLKTTLANWRKDHGTK